MIQEITKRENYTDAKGNPSGGCVKAKGMSIFWQDGPRGLGEGMGLDEPNGAFVETVIEAARQRLEFFQTASDGRYACKENLAAINNLEAALIYLQLRETRRAEGGILGVHVTDETEGVKLEWPDGSPAEVCGWHDGAPTPEPEPSVAVDPLAGYPESVETPVLDGITEAGAEEHTDEAYSAEEPELESTEGSDGPWCPGDTQA